MTHDEAETKIEQIVDRELGEVNSGLADAIRNAVKLAWSIGFRYGVESCTNKESTDSGTA